VDALIRPEQLRITAAANGNGTAPGANSTAPGANSTAPGANGTVTIATFLGSITRVHALLSGDVTVQVDVPSTESAALAPGTSVRVSVAEAEVLVTGRR
jgi:ABC-type Fe3+/spermidine/putrescine transport system ATPase subunit